MVSGAHVVLFTEDADADRLFLRDVLGLPFVDAGGGWLIFRLPPSEVAVHPTERGAKPKASAPARAELYLMTEDVEGAIAALADQGIDCDEPEDVGWGVLTAVALPSGRRIGIYEPRHATALDL